MTTTILKSGDKVLTDDKQELTIDWITPNGDCFYLKDSNRHDIWNTHHKRSFWYRNQLTLVVEETERPKEALAEVSEKHTKTEALEILQSMNIDEKVELIVNDGAVEITSTVESILEWLNRPVNKRTIFPDDILELRYTKDLSDKPTQQLEIPQPKIDPVERKAKMALREIQDVTKLIVDSCGIMIELMNSPKKGHFVLLLSFNRKTIGAAKLAEMIETELYESLHRYGILDNVEILMQEI